MAKTRLAHCAYMITRCRPPRLLVYNTAQIYPATVVHCVNVDVHLSPCTDLDVAYIRGPQYEVHVCRKLLDESFDRHVSVGQVVTPDLEDDHRNVRRYPRRQSANTQTTDDT